jgi:hypothetical protein
MADFEQVMDGLARTAPVQAAQNALRQSLGKGASRWVAEEAGLSQRQAQRWLSANYPRSRASQIMELVAASTIAAHVLRIATRVNPGQVGVYYKGTGRDEKTRNIDAFVVGTQVRVYLERAADDLVREDLEAAADAFSDAIVCGYEEGLEDTLGISDYVDEVEVTV